MKPIAIIAAALIAGFLLVPFTRAGGVPETKPKTTLTGDAALTVPVKTVLTNYFKIHSVLADDSTNGVSTNALAIVNAITEDKEKAFSEEIAEQARNLAEAADLGAEREAFKPLSQSVIDYMAAHKVETGQYNEFFCPMQESSWLQGTNVETTENPYLGSTMPGCGIQKRTF